jgi:hypothetical protein
MRVNMEEIRLMKGNEVIAEAAVRCGCDGYFGYPITPQSEILETLTEMRPWETTGMIVRSKIYIVAGLTCMALSVLFPLYDYFLKKIATSDGIEITAGLLNNEILIFAGVFFIMMVVPGHIINYQSHKRCSRN